MRGQQDRLMLNGVPYGATMQLQRLKTKRQKSEKDDQVRKLVEMLRARLLLIKELGGDAKSAAEGRKLLQRIIKRRKKAARDEWMGLVERGINFCFIELPKIETRCSNGG